MNYPPKIEGEKCPSCADGTHVKNPNTGKIFCDKKCWLNKTTQVQGNTFTPQVPKQDRIDEAIKNKNDNINWYNAKNNATLMCCHGKITRDELRAQMEWYYAQDAPDEIQKIETKVENGAGFAQGGESTNPIDNITFN